MAPPFIRRVTLRNYKSIAACQVDLGALMFLVGRNGAGKSNFLDAIRFVADALWNSLDHALRERGGIREVRRISGGHPHHFSVRLDFCLPSGQTGHYSFRIGGKPNGGYEVQSEECKIYCDFATDQYFYVEAGQVIETSVTTPMPPAFRDRLFLNNAAGIPEFRPVYDALSRIAVYNLSPRDIAAAQKPDPLDILRRRGENSASILQKMSGEARDKIRGHLARIVPGIADFGVKALGNQEIIEFRQTVKNQKHPWIFPAESMSDGTLRAFGVLLAVFQAASIGGQSSPPLLVGLEEPEIALHPAAAGYLLASLFEGSKYCQILVSSHSPDLLDDWDIPIDALLAVDNTDGVTNIASLDQVNVDVIRERLMTAGELLRQNQIRPDDDVINSIVNERQLKLFDMGHN